MTQLSQSRPRDPEAFLSVQAYSWAIDQRIVEDPTTQLVLMCLAYYAGVDGANAFPSVERLSADSRLSERTVQYHLKKLLELGIIEAGNEAVVAAYISRSDRRPSAYNIKLPRGAPNAPRKSLTGCSSQQNGVQLATSRGAPAAPDPILKSEGEPKSVLQTTKTLAEDPDWRFASPADRAKRLVHPKKV
jgi:DNA-binding transcriptional ArsR family regulator